MILGVRRLFFLLLASVAVVSAEGVGEARSVTSVVVVANGNVPESVRLALYYASVRSIPSNQVVFLDLPVTEEMNRQEYNNRLKAPLLEALEARGLARRVEKKGLLKRKAKEGGKSGVVEYELAYCGFKYFVTMYGVPLRISDSRAHFVLALKNRLGLDAKLNAASVDSELSLIFRGDYSLKGQVANPFYDAFFLPSPSRDQHDLVACTRLDGPKPEVVKRMIDASLRAERYGVQGRVYVDTQGLSRGAYLQGDFWLYELAERLKREGYETSIDTRPGTYLRSYPMEDVAFYFGWYDEDVSGPFLRPDVRFTEGAVSTHIHSFSASTLRSMGEHWAGPLLARGAAVTSGAVSEPYLAYMPHLNILVDRMVRGLSLGDAAMMSLRSFSWQSTIIGDPLYRPFAFSLEEQIVHGEADKHPLLEYAYLRKANVLVGQGRFNVGLAFLRQKINETESAVLREKLGDLYVLNNLLQPGVAAYNVALHGGDISDARAARIGAKLIYAYQRMGKVKQAELIEKTMVDGLKGHPVTGWFQAVVKAGRR